MWFTFLLQAVNHASRPNRRGRPQVQKPSRRQTGSRHLVLPRLEMLEDRTLPSVFLVQNLSDAGPGSLRAAISAANANPGADEIDFAPGLGGTIHLASGSLSITDTVTIDGPGASKLAVSGDDTHRVLDISGGASAAIQGLAIVHGSADQGAGIFNESGSSLSVTDCTFTNNNADGGDFGTGFGGGILAAC